MRDRCPGRIFSYNLCCPDTSWPYSVSVTGLSSLLPKGIKRSDSHSLVSGFSRAGAGGKCILRIFARTGMHARAWLGTRH